MKLDKILKIIYIICTIFLFSYMLYYTVFIHNKIRNTNRQTNVQIKPINNEGIFIQDLYYYNLTNFDHCYPFQKICSNIKYIGILYKSLYQVKETNIELYLKDLCQSKKIIEFDFNIKYYAPIQLKNPIFDTIFIKKTIDNIYKDLLTKQSISLYNIYDEKNSKLNIIKKYYIRSNKNLINLWDYYLINMINNLYIKNDFMIHWFNMDVYNNIFKNAHIKNTDEFKLILSNWIKILLTNVITNYNVKMNTKLTFDQLYNIIDGYNSKNQIYNYNLSNSLNRLFTNPRERFKYLVGLYNYVYNKNIKQCMLYQKYTDLLKWMNNISIFELDLLISYMSYLKL